MVKKNVPGLYLFIHLTKEYMLYEEKGFLKRNMFTICYCCGLRIYQYIAFY